MWLELPIFFNPENSDSVNYEDLGIEIEIDDEDLEIRNVYLNLSNANFISPYIKDSSKVVVEYDNTNFLVDMTYKDLKNKMNK